MEHSVRRPTQRGVLANALAVPWSPGGALAPWCPGPLAVPWRPGALVPWCPGGDHAIHHRHFAVTSCMITAGAVTHCMITTRSVTHCMITKGRWTGWDGMGMGWGWVPR